MVKTGLTAVFSLLISLLLLALLGWWMFTWSTHTLVWVAAFFGVVIGVGSTAKK